MQSLPNFRSASSELTKLPNVAKTTQWQYLAAAQFCTFLEALLVQLSRSVKRLRTAVPPPSIHLLPQASLHV